MNDARTYPGRAIVLLSLLLAMAQAQAVSLVVTTTADPAVGTDDCTPPSGNAVVCVSLRGAITRALASVDVTSTITLAPLDGQTILLSQFSNDLGCVTSNSVSCTSGTLGAEFGASAFFITRGKALTIDATASGAVHGVTIARCTDSAACYGNGPVPNFRLFDVARGNALTLRGLSLKNGFALGGNAVNGGGALGAGGAIFNQGQLFIDRCTLTSNSAQGGDAVAYMFGNLDRTGGGGAGQPGQTVNQSDNANGGGPNGGLGGVKSNSGGGSGADGSLGGGGGAGGTGVGSNGGQGGGGGFGGGGGPGGDGLYDTTHPVDGGNGGFGGFGGGGGGQGYPFFTDGPGASSFGGGVGSNDGTASTGGSGAGMGGAIFNDAGSVAVTNSTFAGNSASGGANALASSTDSAGYGGALFNYNGSMTLDFVTLSGNTAAAGTGGTGGSADGGAVYSLGDSPASCSAGGNPCATSAASLTMLNTIAANNNVGTNDVATNAINGGGNASDGGGNLITTNAGFGGTVVSTADPQLGALIPGGGIESVMIPKIGSPAIDTGACDATTVDQRGDPRPWQQTPCDIGAVETNDRIFRNGFE